RERVDDFIETEEGTRATRVKRWRETLPNGVSYTTLDLVDNGFYDNTPVYQVPAGHFFMMGDNRDNSTDSRVLSQVGYVPCEMSVGRAEFFFFWTGGGERVGWGGGGRGAARGTGFSAFEGGAGGEPGNQPPSRRLAR